MSFGVGLPPFSVSELFYKLFVVLMAVESQVLSYSIAEYSLLMSLHTLNDLLVVLGMSWKATNSFL